MTRRSLILICGFLLAAGCPAVSSCHAEDEGKQNVTSDVLRNDQLSVTGRYERFERLLSEMADILGHEDPERAELLRRAVSKGREQAITRQLNTIADELGAGDLGRAEENQASVIASLNALLQLLQSEDRRSELEKEREHLSDVLKDVRNTLNQQRSAHSRSQNAQAPSSSAPDQQRAIDSAEDVLDDIREYDDRSKDGESPKNSSSEPGSGEDSNSDEQDSSDTSPRDDSEDDKDPKAGDNQRSDAEDGDSSKTSDESDDNRSETADPAKDPSPDGGRSAEQSQSEQSQSEQSQSKQSRSQNNASQDQPPPDTDHTPGREEVEQALRKMQEALKQLQDQKRDEAGKSQTDAISDLVKAVEKLQKRLLQLREEEKEMILASLEARFQRMLAIETQIHDNTLDLAATPRQEWLDAMYARSREVAQQQAELQVDCDHTLGLLREDGTSVAIVLSVEDISVDMKTIVERLRESKVDSLTQTLQTDIIESLRELIEATQNEMQEMKSEERQQSTQQGEQKPPELVELIAEIRVLRSLQLRVNQRTQRVDRILTDDPSIDPGELTDQLRELADRQQRLVESAAQLNERMEQQQ